MSVTVSNPAQGQPSYLGRFTRVLNYADGCASRSSPRDAKGWLKIEGPDGSRLVNVSSLTKNTVVLAAGSKNVESEASSGEIVAGAGFNSDVEPSTRGPEARLHVGRQDGRFATATGEVTAFLTQGGLREWNVKTILRVFPTFPSLLILAGCGTSNTLQARLSGNPSDIRNRWKPGSRAARSGRKVAKANEDFYAEQEYYIGRTVAANGPRDLQAWDGPKANEYLNTLGNTWPFLVLPETFKGYHFLIMDTDEINAFGAPSGFVLHQPRPPALRGGARTRLRRYWRTRSDTFR